MVIILTSADDISEPSDQKVENPICEECGFTASPDEFDASISAYHDLKCPKCGTTNIDWDYGGYKHNNLDMSRYDEHIKSR